MTWKLRKTKFSKRYLPKQIKIVGKETNKITHESTTHITIFTFLESGKIKVKEELIHKQISGKVKKEKPLSYDTDGSKNSLEFIINMSNNSINSKKYTPHTMWESKVYYSK